MKTDVHIGGFIIQRGWVFSMINGAIVAIYWGTSGDNSSGFNEKLLSTKHI